MRNIKKCSDLGILLFTVYIFLLKFDGSFGIYVFRLIAILLAYSAFLVRFWIEKSLRKVDILSLIAMAVCLVEFSQNAILIYNSIS